jgi:hypothetical protein
MKEHMKAVTRGQPVKFAGTLNNSISIYGWSAAEN